MVTAAIRVSRSSIPVSGGAINILWIVDDRAIRPAISPPRQYLGKRLIGIFTAYRNDIFQILIRVFLLNRAGEIQSRRHRKVLLTSAPVTPSSVRGGCAASSGLKTSPFGLLAITRSEVLVDVILSLIVISPNDCRKRRPRAKVGRIAECINVPFLSASRLLILRTAHPGGRFTQ